MNAYNITDPTVLDYAECLWHLNRVLDSPDSLTSSVVGAVQRKVLESEDRILS